ncbi:MAG: hypothetical protein GY856_03220 [bacterium]|nr:hypothetical protein [bacterium]
MGPPATLTVEACLAHLEQILDVPAKHSFYSHEIFESYFSRDDAPERLVLLFDEFDRYAEKGEPSSQPPGRGFFNDLEAARRASSTTADGIEAEVDHFLLRLPRR